MASKEPVRSPNSAGTLEAESFEATARKMLETALTLYEAERSLATQEIRGAVRSLVAHAKAQGAQAERLLIDLKRTWNGTESASQQKPEVIAVLVTMCIREFYGADSEPSEG